MTRLFHPAADRSTAGRPATNRPAGGRRIWGAVFGACLGLLPGSVILAGQTVEQALAYKPSQAGVDYDVPADPKKCTIAMEKENGVSAWVVRDAAGDPLRAFADTNANRVVDRWSYYKEGLEVYRDIDSDHDTKVDQCRWLNAAGTRWGLDEDENGVIDAWKVLSAEEATAEIVAAVRGRDAAGFARLLPSKADLQAAGFEGDRLAELAARVAAAPEAFATLLASKEIKGRLSPDARWSSMQAPQPPGVIPAGTPGVAQDVLAYDNLVAIVESKGGNSQFFVGSLVRCGDVWRPLDAPQFAGETGDFAAAAGFFSPRQGGRSPTPGAAAPDDRLKPLILKLQAIEGRLAGADAAGRKGLVAEQVTLLEQLLAAATPADRGFWARQLVETLAAYTQEGLVADGIERLEKIAAAVGGEPSLAAFVAFRLAQARYTAEMQRPGADAEKLQNAWFAELEAFVAKYPDAPEAAESLLQLAFRDEFENREQEAVKRYGEVVKAFPDTPQARKAAGAVRRLESVGKPLVLTGPTLDGKPFSLASLKGVPVLVHYWSTDCEPCKVELAQIRELQAKYGPRRLAVVGVALDGDKAKLQKFLQSRPIPWPQVYEPGGLDSRLAEEFGVLALPTMVLIDAEGRVVDRNVSITELERKLETVVAAK